MSSSSYLGHGAKYWADKYYELQTQTRLPDDSSILKWKDRCLNLEKSCSLYQSKIEDLRAEIADLREKSVSKSDDQLTENFKAILSDNKKVLRILKIHATPSLKN